MDTRRAAAPADDGAVMTAMTQAVRIQAAATATFVYGSCMMATSVRAIQTWGMFRTAQP